MLCRELVRSTRLIRWSDGVGRGRGCRELVRSARLIRRSDGVGRGRGCRELVRSARLIKRSDGIGHGQKVKSVEFRVGDGEKWRSRHDKLVFIVILRFP